MVSQATEQAGEYARYAADQLREGYNRISDQFGRRYEQSQDMIRENPTRSIATAFGVGVLLGVVVGMALRPAEIPPIRPGLPSQTGPAIDPTARSASRVLRCGPAPFFRRY